MVALNGKKYATYMVDFETGEYLLTDGYYESAVELEAGIEPTDPSADRPGFQWPDFNWPFGGDSSGSGPEGAVELE